MSNNGNFIVSNTDGFHKKFSFMSHSTKCSFSYKLTQKHIKVSLLNICN